MKKIFKWILRIFLFLFLISLAWGLYFYFFPMYPDYGISEEYFETRFHSEWFDSPKNSYEEWRMIIEGMSTQSEILSQIDMHFKCSLEDTCLWDLQDLNNQQRVESLERFLASAEYNQDFWNFRDTTLLNLQTLASKELINTHDYEDLKNLVTWKETKPILTNTQLIQFSRAIILHYDNTSNKQVISIFKTFYDSIAQLTHKMDSSIIDYLLFITLLNPQLDYFIDNIDRYSKAEKLILKNILEREEISDSMIQNGLRAEYQNSKVLFDILNSNQDLAANENTSGMRKTLFYSHSDTMNLLKKSYYDAIENKTIFEISNNGRNYIGRLMLDIWQATYVSQFKKQTELLKKREELIQLLSN